jgi:hypothetical protein
MKIECCGINRETTLNFLHSYPVARNCLKMKNRNPETNSTLLRKEPYAHAKYIPHGVKNDVDVMVLCLPVRADAKVTHPPSNDDDDGTKAKYDMVCVLAMNPDGKPSSQVGWVWADNLSDAGNVLGVLERLTNDSCSICMDSFKDADPSSLVITNCDHIFHQQCLNRCMQDADFRDTCPLCKKPHGIRHL